MGCVCSSGKAEKGDFRSISDEYCGISGYDSCELRKTPVRTGTGKVPEMTSIFGRAGMAGLEKAVEVLDTLGSSMSNLNASGFISSVAPRGHKISILAFEVANTIAKGANLLRSLSEENIQLLKEEVLKSDGIRELVSSNFRDLMIIAAADKRDELVVFSAEVIRFGNLCKDPVWHNLDRYFDKLGSELTPQEQLKEEIETSMQQLIDLAQNTSELYHELHALDRFEQDYQRKLHEEGAIPATRRENLMILHSELKRQRKLVKGLKKKSLWSRKLEEVVEVIVDVVVYLNKVILEAFSVTDSNFVEHGPIHNQRLGVSGLALHYANIINQIDNIVSRPLALPPNTRNTLYQGLPTGVKAALRSKLQSFDTKEEYTAAQIKAEMQKTLRWIVPLAENTIRAHQGFGWVGEWANIWWIPDGQLCPTVPNRSNYIHWIEDLLSSELIPPISGSDGKIRGFDIGTGANCIYPLLGASLLGWNFVGSDVTDVALEWARKNVESNPNISELIDIRNANSSSRPSEAMPSVNKPSLPDDAEPSVLQKAESLTQEHQEGCYEGPSILAGVVRDGEYFDFCMCNPPFFESMEEAGLNPRTSCGGTYAEMVCPGGERAFVTRIIEDSVMLKHAFRWFTSMVGRKANLKFLISKLREVGVSIVKSTEFVQGQTCRWGLAWSFVSPAKKIISSNHLGRNDHSFMLEGLPRKFGAFQVLKSVESFFQSSGASSKTDLSSFSVNVTVSNDQKNMTCKDGHDDECAHDTASNGSDNKLLFKEPSFRISVFEQIPGTVLVRGELRKQESPFSGMFSSLFLQLMGSLKKEFLNKHR